MKKQLMVLLALVLVIAMVPANTLVAQTPIVNTGFVSPVTIESVTPGGVTFGYQSFREVDRVNFNATHNFAVNVRVTSPAALNAFVAMEFEWLRNGVVWAGSGGTGVVPRTAFHHNHNDYLVRLQLRGGQGQATRGGDWQLRVTLFDAHGDIISEDTSRVGVLNVGGYTPDPTPTPTPGPGDDGGTGTGDTGTGDKVVVVIVTPPPVIVVNRSVTNIVITHQLTRIVNQRNVHRPKVRLVVRRGTGVIIRGETFVKVRNANAGFTIVNNVRKTTRSVVRTSLQITISHRVINTWTVTDESEVKISIRQACRQSFDQRFNSKRRRSRRFSSITVVNRILITQLFEINLRIDNVPVVFPGGPGSNETETDNESYLTMNIADLNLNPVQLSRLGVLFFYLQNHEDLESLSYRMVRVYVNDDYIKIPILGDGWFGLIELPENYDVEDNYEDDEEVTDEEYDEDEEVVEYDDEDDDDQGEDDDEQ